MSSSVSRQRIIEKGWQTPNHDPEEITLAGAAEALRVLKERLEEHRCPNKPEECSSRHFGYSVALDDFNELLDTLLTEITET